MKHLYLAFWAPAILTTLQDNDTTAVAICDWTGSSREMSCDTREVDCPACRETFLESLATGTGVKTTWKEYNERKAANPYKTLAQRAAETDAKLPVVSPEGWGTDTRLIPTESPGLYVQRVGRMHRDGSFTPAKLPGKQPPAAETAARLTAGLNPAPGPQADMWATGPVMPAIGAPKPGGSGSGSKTDPVLIRAINKGVRDMKAEPPGSPVWDGWGTDPWSTKPLTKK